MAFKFLLSFLNFEIAPVLSSEHPSSSSTMFSFPLTIFKAVTSSEQLSHLLFVTRAELDPSCQLPFTFVPFSSTPHKNSSIYTNYFFRYYLHFLNKYVVQNISNDFVRFPRGIDSSGLSDRTLFNQLKFETAD